MVKANSQFVCQNCGAQYPKWQGQCQQCAEWGSLVEEAAAESTNQISRSSKPAKVVPFPEVELVSAAKQRVSTNIGEVDRVLGGGVVLGMVMLLGGEPGIGKSTLVTELALRWPPLHSQFVQTSRGKGQGSESSTSNKSRKGNRLMADEQASVIVERTDKLSTNSETNPTELRKTKSTQFKNQEGFDGGVLYLAGEESVNQISYRINRILNIEQQNTSKKIGQTSPKYYPNKLSFLTTTMVEQVVATIQQQRPSLVIIDSINTLTSTELTGTAGSLGQLKESTQQVIDVVKPLNIPTILIGHVTKEGNIAGPKVLEHQVDTVLELSGERSRDVRLLRTLKNRFGPTDEVGVFRQTELGLVEVSNPNELFLEHTDQPVPGSVTTCILEGTRPLLLEVQALVIPSKLAMPRRVGRGVAVSQLQVLTAVVQKQLKLPLENYDVYVSVAGGFSTKDPALDLAIVVAMMSSHQDQAVPKQSVFIGEVGLLGEVRSVASLEKRIKEAKRLGFGRVVSQKSVEWIGQIRLQGKGK